MDKTLSLALGLAGLMVLAGCADTGDQSEIDGTFDDDTGQETYTDPWGGGGTTTSTMGNETMGTATTEPTR